MKRRRGQFLLLLFSALLSLAALEFGIRRFMPFYDPRRQIVFRVNETYGATLGPRDETVRQRTPKGDYDLQVRFNRYGFRDAQDLANSTPDDLFVLGDSFSMGWGVPEEARYSDALASSTGRRVFNISAPNDLQEYAGVLRYARNNGANISYLVLGVCMNNDLKNYETPAKVQPARFGDRQPWKDRLRTWLKSRSAFYLYMSYEIQRYEFLRVVSEKLGISRDINQLTLQNIFDADVLASSKNRILEIVRPFPPGHAIVLIIPSLALWLGDNQETERKIHETFVQDLRNAGAPVLDLKPLMEATGRPRESYFKTDPHWNEFGHAIAAEALADWIRAHGDL